MRFEEAVLGMGHPHVESVVGCHVRRTRVGITLKPSRQVSYQAVLASDLHRKAHEPLQDAPGATRLDVGRERLRQAHQCDGALRQSGSRITSKPSSSASNSAWVSSRSIHACPSRASSTSASWR